MGSGWNWLIYISHCKYQVKPYWSLWFSVACAAAIIHRNHFFCLFHQNKFSESKVKFRQASNHCKRFLEAAKLACANKAKESITSQMLGSWDFLWIGNSVLNKGKSAIPSTWNDSRSTVIDHLKSICDHQKALLNGHYDCHDLDIATTFINFNSFANFYKTIYAIM